MKHENLNKQETVQFGISAVSGCLFNRILNFKYQNNENKLQRN